MRLYWSFIHLISCNNVIESLSRRRRLFSFKVYRAYYYLSVLYNFSLLFWLRRGYWLSSNNLLLL
jgi:hypothetical protein